MSGLTSHIAGLAAEAQVARHYLDQGHRLICRRWRGRAGEIDLIVEKDDELVFVEVKKSRSRTKALQNLTPRQAGRLMRSAEDCLGHFPRQSLTAMRVDVAVVDALGQIEVIPNALMH
jgi:putative endonuclease